MIVSALFVLRLISVLNAIGDTAIDELLHGHAMISKLGLALGAASGQWPSLSLEARTQFCAWEGFLQESLREFL